MTEPPRVEAIDRALALLTALAEAGPGGASLARLCEETGVNKSTAYRALATFRSRGFARQRDDGDHVLGPAATGLGDRFLGRDHLVGHLHPALVELSRLAGELVHLGAMVDADVVYLDKVEPTSRAIRVWSAVGQRVPVATSSLGRALLAAQNVPDEQLTVYNRALPAGRDVRVDRLRDVVTDARRTGIAVEVEENEPGVACVGVALMRGTDAVAALSITSLASRMTPSRIEELADIVRRELPPLLPDGLALFTGR